MSSIDHPDFASPLVAGSNLIFSRSNFAVAASGNFTTGALDVSSFSQVMVNVTALAGLTAANFQAQWFTNPGLGTFVGSSPFWFKSGPGTVTMLLAVAGPVLDFLINNSDAAIRNFSLQVFGLTDSHEPALVFPAQQIATVSTPGVAVNGTTQVQAAPSINSDALFSVNSSAAPTQGRLDMWNGAAWVFFAFLSVTTANLGVVAKVTLPFSDVRIVITNLATGTSTLQGSLTAPSA